MRISSRLLFPALLLLTLLIYLPGLSGDWLFDDYPNIVDNPGVQPADAKFSTLLRAALSSPASEFKRPLASLSFAANYRLSGLDPYGMKLTNLSIHLLNGLLLFVLMRRLLPVLERAGHHTLPAHTAALIAGGWLLLPINLTAVLYTVQRMESLANLFVLLGLVGYLVGRERMLHRRRGSLWLCAASLTLPTALGLLAKETAVMLPLYAFLLEFLVFRGRTNGLDHRQDPRIWWMFSLLLFLPMAIGLSWLAPGILNPAAWATRDFTLPHRLLSEARIVLDYLWWTVLPTPHALSFYHDDFRISTGLLSPWTTLPCVLLILLAPWLIWRARRTAPWVSLGLAWFFGAQLLTGTVLPLELIYEHRNYFASAGLLLALFGVLGAVHGWLTDKAYPLIAGMLLVWSAETLTTSYAWGDDLRLARELAARSPDSPRSQYELGRTYIIYSQYDPESPYTALAYAPLERAMRLPKSPILPEQALIFMNARMERPLEDTWWDSMETKLRSRPSGVQDESSLAALTQCAREEHCKLPTNRMQAAFQTALSHAGSNARLRASYADYAWYVMDDLHLALGMLQAAASMSPNEPTYHEKLLTLYLEMHQIDYAKIEITALKRLDRLGYLTPTITHLQQRLDN